MPESTSAHPQIVHGIHRHRHLHTPGMVSASLVTIGRKNPFCSSAR
jgi:hypothetical protein